MLSALPYSEMTGQSQNLQLIGVKDSTLITYFIMTQRALKILALVSIAGASLAMFGWIAVVCILCSAFFIYKYIKTLLTRYLSKGIIEILPNTVRNHLLYRSIFDIVCDFWFYDSFVFLKRFFKLLCKPLIQPVQQDNALQALHDIDPQMKKVYLVKGVVRVMPDFCQRILLGSERAQIQKLKWQEQQQLNANKMIKGSSSDRNTDDHSYHNEPRRLKRVNSESQINIITKLQEQSPLSRKKFEAQQGFDQVVTRVAIDSRALKRPKRQNLLQTAQHSLKMLKRLLQMQNITQHIHRMSTASIIKVMCVFWIALLIQVKFNKNARKIVIKTLYILGGMITVFGTVGTTGVLIIKHIKKRKNSSTISEVDA